MSALEKIKALQASIERIESLITEKKLERKGIEEDMLTKLVSIDGEITTLDNELSGIKGQVDIVVELLAEIQTEANILYAQSGKEGGANETEVGNFLDRIGLQAPTEQEADEEGGEEGEAKEAAA